MSNVRTSRSETTAADGGGGAGAQAVSNPSGLPARLRVALWGLFAMALVGTGWLMTGSAPREAGGSAPKDPPPLVVDESAGRRLEEAGAALGEGKLGLAERRFTDLVAERPDDALPQVGLVLSRWRKLGPTAVERDMEQLRREYPGSAEVTVHLALVRIFSGDRQAAGELLRQALAEAQSADPPKLHLARRADDLLHPSFAPGYPPLLVGADDLSDSRARELARALTEAVGDDDRRRAGELAERASILASRPGLAETDRELLRVAAAVAGWDKDTPAAGTRALQLVARESTGDAGAAARLHRGLLLLWSGERRAGLVELEALGKDGDSRWHRQAAAVAKRLG